MKEQRVAKRKPRTQITPQGAEIPIPKRKDVLRDLHTVATPAGQPEPKAGN